MKKICLILVIVSMALSGCGVMGFMENSRRKEAVLDYLEEKYEKEFQISGMKYKKNYTHDPVIPVPEFLLSDSNVLLVDVVADDNTKFVVTYDMETGKMMDDYHEDEISNHILCFIRDYGIWIQGVELVYIDEKHTIVTYPKGADSVYDVSAEPQEEYAYDYLQEQEVGIFSGWPIEVTCSEEVVDEITERCDLIFKELLRGENNVVVDIYLAGQEEVYKILNYTD